MDLMLLLMVGGTAAAVAVVGVTVSTLARDHLLFRRLRRRLRRIVRRPPAGYIGER